MLLITCYLLLHECMHFPYLGDKDPLLMIRSLKTVLNIRFNHLIITQIKTVINHRYLLVRHLYRDNMPRVLSQRLFAIPTHVRQRSVDLF